MHEFHELVYLNQFNRFSHDLSLTFACTFFSCSPHCLSAFFSYTVPHLRYLFFFFFSTADPKTNIVKWSLIHGRWKLFGKHKMSCKWRYFWSFVSLCWSCAHLLSEQTGHEYILKLILHINSGGEIHSTLSIHVSHLKQSKTMWKCFCCCVVCTAPHSFKFPSKIFCVPKCHHAKGNTTRAAQNTFAHQQIRQYEFVIFSFRWIPHSFSPNEQNETKQTEPNRGERTEQEDESAWTFYHFAN